MVTQNPKAVSPSPEKFPSAALVWRVGMVLLVCVALFAGCGGGDDPLDPQLKEALGKLESTSDTVRLAGLTTLSGMGDKPKPHADKVAAVLKDTSPEVRSLAALLLGIWRHSTPEVVQELSARPPVIRTQMREPARFRPFRRSVPMMSSQKSSRGFSRVTMPT